VAAPLALVVDDVLEVRRFVAAALEEAGLAVVAAASYDEALGALDERIIFVITDIEMPGRSGVELLAAIRARRPELPIVAMSGNGLALGEASQAGADALLLKPFALDELRTLIQLLALTPAPSSSDADERAGREPGRPSAGATGLHGRQKRRSFFRELSDA
jgi:CheY-like chemotaxis protein